jgi:hypothetical protein
MVRNGKGIDFIIVDPYVKNVEIPVKVGVFMAWLLLQYLRPRNGLRENASKRIIFVQMIPLLGLFGNPQRRLVQADSKRKKAMLSPLLGRDDALIYAGFSWNRDR